MEETIRKHFDLLLDEVIEDLPDELRELLEEVPLVVDDEPTSEIMEETGVEDVDYLCGLYTGIPLTRKSVEHSGTLPEVIHIFRRGILAASANQQGNVGKKALRQQIRLTLLHEIGHHFGMGEEDLRKYGYG